MDYNKILEFAKDTDISKDDIVEYIEHLQAKRKSDVKHIITKEDAFFQNVRLVSLLVDALDSVTMRMIEQQKKMPLINPVTLSKIKTVQATNRSFVNFNDKAFQKPKGENNSDVYDFGDLCDEFQELMFKCVDNIKL